MQAASSDKPSDSTAAEAVQPKPSQLPEAVSGTATTMRSFRDVFAPEAAGVDTQAESSVPVFEFAEVQQGELEQLQASGSQQREATAGEKLISPEYGYAAISGTIPSKRDRGSLLATHPKLHPQRMFMPGDIYEPEVCAKTTPGACAPLRAQPTPTPTTCTGTAASSTCTHTWLKKMLPEFR